MRFCNSSTFAQKIFKGRGWDFIWSFGKVMRTYSMKMVLVASMIRSGLCIIYAFFDYFSPKSFFIKNYFLIAATNWLTGVCCILVLFILLIEPSFLGYCRFSIILNSANHQKDLKLPFFLYFNESLEKCSVWLQVGVKPLLFWVF